MHAPSLLLLLAALAPSVLGGSFYFEAYQTSNPNSPSGCNGTPVSAGSGSKALPCFSEPEGFNMIEFDGVGEWNVHMYSGETCGGTAAVRGDGATGCVGFNSAFHSWKIVKA